MGPVGICKQKWKKIIIYFFLLIVLLTKVAIPVVAEEISLNGEDHYTEKLKLTTEEKLYIENREPISAASIDGVAPLHYKNSTGEIVGIAVRTLDNISEKTGLKFDYELYESVPEALNSNSDIIFGISPLYTLKDLKVTQPYLNSKSILFMNSSLNSNELADEKYAAIEGGTLPAGINEKNVLYYQTREESLDAVENGEAGYGYGNEYSVAYYTIRNSYENLLSVPTVKEIREYSVGMLKEDEILLSILNKAIQQIDETQMNQLILEEAGNIEKRISFSMLISEYGEIIFILAFIIISILLLIINSNIRSRRELSLQNKRHQLLSDISNECLFEYDIQLDKIYLSERCLALFGSEGNLQSLYKPLREIILSEKSNGNSETIQLKLDHGEVRVFKVIKSMLYGDDGKKYYIIGKLTDISEEAAEKKKLIIQSEMDGLTNLYNHMTTKKLVNERIKKQSAYSTDALILIDCDNFKGINDTFGHLEGDEALRNVSEVLKTNFRQKDIIGRIGGDEFCVYMKDIPSKKAVELKSAGLISQISEKDKKHNLTFSIGIAFLNEERDYNELFEKADLALYQAKDEGRARAVPFTEELLN